MSLKYSLKLNIVIWLLLSSSVLRADDVADYQKNVDEIGKQIEEISKNLNANKALLKTQRDELHDIEKEISSLGKSINNTDKKLATQKAQGESLLQQLESLENQQQTDKGLRILHGLQGRAHDFIKTADGKVVHGQFFTHVIVFEPGIKNYQIVQKTYSDIRIRIVKEQDYSEQSEKSIRSAIQSYLGKNVNVRFEYVQKIELSPRGKYRWIISEVQT